MTHAEAREILSKRFCVGDPLAIEAKRVLSRPARGAAKLPVSPKDEKGKPVYLPMTAEDRAAVEAMRRVRLASGAWSTRRIIASLSITDQITERQRAFLWSTCWRYRRQLPTRIVDLAVMKLGSAR